MNGLANILWQPVAQPMHVIGGAVVLAVVAAVAYGRTWRQQPRANAGLLAMRLLVIAALATLLMGPSILPDNSTDTTLPQLDILLDTSGSMATPDCGGKSRIEHAALAWLTSDQLATLGRSFRVQLHGLDEELHPLSADALAHPLQAATGRSSRIAQLVQKCVTDPSGGKGRAVLLFSDGRDLTDTPMSDVALLALGNNVPVYTVPLGGPTVQKDLTLVAQGRQECLFVGEQGQVLATVYQSALPSTHTRVKMYRKDAPADVVSADVVFNGQPSVTVPLPVQLKAEGQYEYVVTLDPVAGEVELANNTQSVFLQATKARINVLLLEGEPYWETKFLAQSLRKDARVALTQISRVSQKRQERIVSAGGNGAGVSPASGPADARGRDARATTTQPASAPAVPKTPTQFGEYDVVILGRGIENMLDPAAAGALVKYVSQGGGNVVFARGQAYDADTPAGRSLARDLAALEPVVWGRGSLHNLSLQLTLDGRANPCFTFPSIQRPAVEVVPSLPGFLVMPVIEREKAATVVLARMAPAGIAGGLAPADSTAQAGVAMMPYGRGRCLAVLGEGLWRWSLLSPSQKAFDGVYDAFWSDIIRYLAMGSDFLPGRVAYLHLGRSSVAVGQPVLAEAGFRGDAPVGARLTITGPDGRPQQVALTPPPGQQGRLAGRFTPTQAGTYRAMLEVPGQTPQGRWFSVYDLNVEKLNTAADAEALALLARQSGGLVLADGDAKDLAGRIAAHQASQAVPPRLEYIWNTAALLTIMMVWLAGEWLARRKVGLL